MKNIIEVDGQVFSPSALTWGLNDISDSAAGRTMDGKMHKNLLVQKRTLSLEWWGTSIEETSRILQAFNPEYISVKFNDALEGHAITKQFYTGDRSASVYRWAENGKIYQTISFNIIEV